MGIDGEFSGMRLYSLPSVRCFIEYIREGWCVIVGQPIGD